jgi:hypothetical protein
MAARLERARMSPVVLTLVSASVSSVVGGITLAITHLSRQRTERLKHSQDNELDREVLLFISTAYERAAADGQAPDLVDLALALRGQNRRIAASEQRDAQESEATAVEMTGSPSLLARVMPRLSSIWFLLRETSP